MLLSKQRMKPFLEPLPIKKKTHPSFLNCPKTFLNKKLVGYVAMLQSPSLKKILIRKTKRTLTWKEQNQQKGFGNKHVVYRNRNIRQSAETVKKKKKDPFSSTRIWEIWSVRLLSKSIFFLISEYCAVKELNMHSICFYSDWC